MMETKKLKAVGMFTFQGKNFVVLDTDFTMPEYIWSVANRIDVPVLYVAQRHVFETETPEIIRNKIVYVTPHWVSVSGTYMIEWFNEPCDVDILIKAEES